MAGGKEIRPEKGKNKENKGSADSAQEMKEYEKEKNEIWDCDTGIATDAWRMQ